MKDFEVHRGGLLPGNGEGRAGQPSQLRISRRVACSRGVGHHAKMTSCGGYVKNGPTKVDLPGVPAFAQRRNELSVSSKQREGVDLGKRVASGEWTPLWSGVVSLEFGEGEGVLGWE